MTSHAGIVPGTVHLVDVAHDLIGSRHHGEDIVLVPTPSADPEDPLNWSRKRKLLQVSMAYVYVIGVGIATAVQYSVLADISADTGITIGQLNTGTGLMFLFLGWACLLWQPVALVYGRRGVYIMSCVLSIGPMVWSAFSKSAGEWYAHRIIIGILASPVESLPEVTVPDLFFAHDRGTFMGIYAFLLFGSNFLAPFFAGFINDGVGWRWVMHFGSIVLAVTAVILFFFMEETMYFRQTLEGVESSDGITEKLQVGGKEGSDTLPVTSPTTFPPPRTWLQKRNLFVHMRGRPRKKQLFTMMYRPLLIMIHFPCIVWAGFLYGINLSWYNVLNGTASAILSAPPYNFASRLVGTAYLAPFVGAGLSSIWSGVTADKFAIRLARRNNGVREPEQRLWPLTVAGVIGSAGLILWGVGAAEHIHFMGLIIGMGMLTFGVVCGGSIALSYSVDCFKELTGETMISVIIIRNTLGFGFSYGITPWVENQGLQHCFIAAAMLALGCTLTFLIIVYVGKSWRRWSAKKYWEYVATSVSPHL
jgi:MFS family permease